MVPSPRPHPIFRAKALRSNGSDSSPGSWIGSTRSGLLGAWVLLFGFFSCEAADGADEDGLSGITGIRVHSRDVTPESVLLQAASSQW